MQNEMIEVPAGLKVSDFPTGYGTKDSIIKALVVQRDAWCLTAKTYAAGRPID